VVLVIQVLKVILVELAAKGTMRQQATQEIMVLVVPVALAGAQADLVLAVLVELLEMQVMQAAVAVAAVDQQAAI
jgi:hypothetical protein